MRSVPVTDLPRAMALARASSSASRRATEALTLDFGRLIAFAAAVKPPCSMTQQKASTSFQSIVRDSGQCFQGAQFICTAAAPRMGYGTRDARLPHEHLV